MHLCNVFCVCLCIFTCDLLIVPLLYVAFFFAAFTSYTYIRRVSVKDKRKPMIDVKLLNLDEERESALFLNTSVQRLIDEKPRYLDARQGNTHSPSASVHRRT